MSKRILGVALAAAVAVGCGVAGGARTVVDTATVLGTFAERMDHASRLTYTARYSTAEGRAVTVVQQPPDLAYLATGSRFVRTPEHTLLCEAGSCRRAPGGGPGPATIARVTGPGFVTHETVLTMVAMAAFVPGARAAPSDQTVAGQPVTCARITSPHGSTVPGQPPPGQAPPGQVVPGQVVPDFSLCLTADGLLASFAGTLPTGGHAAVELRTFDGTAEAASFAVPAGAAVVDVPSLPG